MDRQQVRAEINLAIRQHELRVAVISGIGGVLLLAAATWAVWLALVGCCG